MRKICEANVAFLANLPHMYLHVTWGKSGQSQCVAPFLLNNLEIKQYLVKKKRREKYVGCVLIKFYNIFLEMLLSELYNLCTRCY